MTRFPSFFPQEISQLQRIAERIHFILAFPNPTRQVCVVCLMVTFPVVSDIKGISIRIFENQRHLTFNQASNRLTDFWILLGHKEVGLELSSRIP